jgi:hypothetical protein
MGIENKKQQNLSPLVIGLLLKKESANKVLNI